MYINKDFTLLVENASNFRVFDGQRTIAKTEQFTMSLLIKHPNTIVMAQATNLCGINIGK